MIEKTIDFEGEQFEKGKIIKGKKHTYVEYRNNKNRKIKFFELDEGFIKEITNKEDLKETLMKNYMIK